MTRVKICGITTREDAFAAVEAGADLLGFNFYRKSVRYIEPAAALTICAALRSEFGAGCPALVGLFVNEVVGRISVTLEKVGLPFAQLSGDESAEMLIELRGTAYKSIRPRSSAEALDDAHYFLPHAPSSERLPSLLLDAHKAGMYGGTGEQADQSIAKTLIELTPRLMLAGGLTPENIGEIVTMLRPWGVDVASGVEGEAGRKDHGKIRAFVQAVRQANP